MTPRPNKRRSILVVDDLREITSLMRVLLSKEYDISVAHDGRQAMDLLGQGYTPDAVITDLRMPGMDGYNFIKVLQQNETFQDIPVIVFSVVDLNKAAKKLAHQKVSAYVPKTVMPNKLIAQLKPLLSEVTNEKTYVS